MLPIGFRNSVIFQNRLLDLLIIIKIVVINVMTETLMTDVLTIS